MRESFELAPEGSVYVVDERMRKAADTAKGWANTNLRTTARKIVKRAGIAPWPKLFQNMRSTRQTELSEQFPSHVVCAWMGNSERVAKEHYLQVTDDHFAAASSVSQSPPVDTSNPKQNPKQNRAEMARNEPQRGKEAFAKVPLFPAVAADCENPPCRKVTPTGLEPVLPA